mmetsp:Transcript_82971/g.230468  ORF Transcript_82971/g.230468 Transcript_82971/m.230468 type:complete len:136 (+) Transcript_82971:104-511(+)
MAVFGTRATSSGRFIRRLLSVSMLCLVAYLASGLVGGLAATFVAPQSRNAAAGQNANAPAAVATASDAAGSAEGERVAERVEVLERESLEACVLATEDDPVSVERCSELTYQLADAEQLMLKLQGAFRYVDNDSY